MEHMICSCCQHDVAPRAPSRSAWALVAAFWVVSLAFGLGAAAAAPGWGFILVLSWLLLATATAAVSQRATSWTCPECSASVPPPASVAHAFHPA